MQEIVVAAITLFLVMDPFGNIPVFITVLKKVSDERKRAVLIRELFFALVIMVIFLFLGQHILNLFEIKQSSLAIAGGIVLFIISLGLIFGKGIDAVSPASANSNKEPLLVPLAVPLIAGPASLSVILLLAGKSPDKMGSWLIALLIAFAVNSIVLLLSFPISKFLGKSGMQAMERLMGLILALMAVNMVMNGIEQFIRSTL
ncbi:MAG: MarC family protein [Elusimicrobiaceae bacterium]|nr:MarC family protein [Elusimicrobiaceae bacterium]MBT3955352.1 MarC family protein [Elusimicrobiaceae bacterium]MBT4008488.1 MarC family protein [Elusimicrobiaceae bacterium]MBT4403376.1 MarC family protein [Elusimicrobiaceae bacterium]MBT4440217.1 MarC family protein [Elusimicrobiaceae bacterium]